MKHLEESHKQVKFEDLFLVQCFKLCFLEVKEKVLNLFGRYLKRQERRQKTDLTHKIETYFDWLQRHFTDVLTYLFFIDEISEYNNNIYFHVQRINVQRIIWYYDI